MNMITQEKAMEIVQEFLAEIRRKEKGILALYVIGSLGGGYYRPGQSDIDTVIIVEDGAAITQKRMDRIAEKYRRKYDVPKGFGSVMIREAELAPPYTKSETDEFEFTVELARLKVQGKAVFGEINTDAIRMPFKEDFIRDAVIFEKWAAREFGYPGFEKLQIAGCVNSILMFLRRFLIIEKGVFEFNKFRMIDTYMRSEPPLVDERAFDFIQRKLRDEASGSKEDLLMLRACGARFRDYFNQALLGFDTKAYAAQGKGRTSS